MGDSDQFSDDFGDIDDAALIQAVARVENAPPGSITNSSASLGNSFADDLEDDPNWQSQNRRFINSGSSLQTTLTGAPHKENIRPSTNKNSLGLRQSTSNETNMTRHAWPLMESLAQEPPTHHKLDFEAAKIWIYPSNLAHRDYQYNIIRRALYSNVLVALPTGLGKTFIAAVVMLNWYRWAPDAQIAFLAPTKPLVNQQIDACYTIAGIPRSQTAVMTGGVTKPVREHYYETKRVFFMTPQTFYNDLRSGLANPKKFVCLVIDEAHKATGAYSYVEVVKLLRQHNKSFRVLALTATPGSKVEAVQAVISSLGIARVEIRTEESLDIREYTFRKHTEAYALELSPEIIELKEMYCGLLQPHLDELRSKKACFYNDAEKITGFLINEARKQWMMSPACNNMHQGAKWQILNIFQLLSTLAHPIELLIHHGIRVFYNKVKALEEESTQSKAKGKTAFFKNETFREMMRRAEEIIANPNFSNHPKMDHLVGSILRHFTDAEEENTGPTRVMVFSSFRDSAEEIVNVLNGHRPTIKPHIFIGQQSSKGIVGMAQKEQQEVITQFKEGVYNTLVATSIGEEGLDIGEVDLIVCYDASASPIRMLQRMGRAGRKREGHITVLLVKGKEEDKWAQAQDNYSFIQRSISKGDAYEYDQSLSPRILPSHIKPEVSKQLIVPPVEAAEKSPPRRTSKGKTPKKFLMPEGSRTGFTKASRLGKSGDELLDDDEDSFMPRYSEMQSLAPVYPTCSKEGLLTDAENQEFERRYCNIHGETTEVLSIVPDLERFPEAQRTLSPTMFVGHSSVTKSLVNTIQTIRRYNKGDDYEELRAQFRPEDINQPDPLVVPDTVRVPASGNRQRCVPKEKAHTTSARKRARTSMSFNMDLVEEEEAIVIDSSPKTSLQEDGLDIDEELDEVLEDGENDFTATGKTYEVSDNDDNESLPDAAELLSKYRYTPQKTAARGVAPGRTSVGGKRQRRIADSEDDDDEL